METAQTIIKPNQVASDSHSGNALLMIKESNTLFMELPPMYAKLVFDTQDVAFGYKKRIYSDFEKQISINPFLNLMRPNVEKFLIKHNEEFADILPEDIVVLNTEEEVYRFLKSSGVGIMMTELEFEDGEAVYINDKDEVYVFLQPHIITIFRMFKKQVVDTRKGLYGSINDICEILMSGEEDIDGKKGLAAQKMIETQVRVLEAFHKPEKVN